MWQDLDTRVPWDLLAQNYDKWRADGEFLRLGFWFGFDVTHSHMAGTETVLCAMYEEPEWVQDMFDTYLAIDIEMANRLWDKGYKFDSVHWYDDMGYKGSPFFSPAMYRELLKPYHKRAADWAHEHGAVVELHSCGFIQPLVPDLVEIGIDSLNPLEIKAGMDPVYLKKTFGDKLAFHGGINAQIMDQTDLVRAEMERLIPLLKEGGGYIFASDHSIPNSVSFENMKLISELAHRLGRY
jgi:uroporphyrinogen decarboxylase